MNSAASLTTVLVAVLLGAMSPGPSFLMVARVSMSRSRGAGLAAALGMAGGAVVLSLLAVLGIKAFFTAFPQFYRALQVVGGAYLAYVGVHIWLNARKPVAVEDSRAVGHAGTFRTAFLIQISNPKTIVFYSSVFAAILPVGISIRAAVALPALIFLLEFGWYALVATLLSANGPRSAYMRARLWIDGIAGGLILFLGIRLLLAAF